MCVNVCRNEGLQAQLCAEYVEHNTCEVASKNLTSVAIFDLSARSNILFEHSPAARVQLTPLKNPGAKSTFGRKFLSWVFASVGEKMSAPRRESCLSSVVLDMVVFWFAAFLCRAKSNLVSV